MKQVSDLSDMVKSITTMMSTEVHHDGIASESHMMAAKQNTAITLCCTGLRFGMPKTSVGRHAIIIEIIAAITALV